MLSVLVDFGRAPGLAILQVRVLHRALGVGDPVQLEGKDAPLARVGASHRRAGW